MDLNDKQKLTIEQFRKSINDLNCSTNYIIVWCDIYHNNEFLPSHIYEIKDDIYGRRLSYCGHYLIGLLSNQGILNQCSLEERVEIAKLAQLKKCWLNSIDKNDLFKLNLAMGTNFYASRSRALACGLIQQ